MSDAEPADRETAAVPAYYAREIAERERIVSACPIAVYTASARDRWAWPYKLLSCHDTRPSVRDSCRSLIMDSGSTRYGSPEQVLDAAERTGADWVVAADVTGMEPDGADLPENTDSIERSLLAAADRGRLDRMILPVQPPYHDTLRDYRDRGWLSSVGWVAVGRLLAIDDPLARVEALRTVREAVGPDTHVHALGLGMEPAVVRALCADPDLIDSLDVSTPERSVANGKVPDATMTQHLHRMPSGDESSTVRAQYAAAIATQIAYLLSPESDLVAGSSDVGQPRQRTFGTFVEGDA